MTRIAVVLLPIALTASATAQPSDISSDEQVTFFPTLAWQADGSDAWRVEIHGCIYEPEDRVMTLDALAAMLGINDDRGATASAPASGTTLFAQRGAAFLVDNERNQSVPVRFGPETFLPGPSEPNGHFHGTFLLTNTRIEDLRREQAASAPAGETRPRPRSIAFRAVTQRGDVREFAGRVFVVEREGVSVISDIDDTIKISQVRDKSELLRNTFTRPMRPAPGMADLYATWERDAGATFHYVTSSPWQLFVPLSEFRAEAGFPAGTFHMKNFRLSDETVLELFESPEAHKTRAIEALLIRFPRRRFVLVGDSGERDPEIYAAVARQHAEQIVRILIRDVTNEARDSPRYREIFKGIAREKWAIFKTPDDLGPAAQLPVRKTAP